MSHPLKDKIDAFLLKTSQGEVEPDMQLVEDFGERCKALLVKSLYPTKERLEEPFRLRMSNIGRGARALGLEKLYGREKLSPEVFLKMVYGGMYEEIFMHLLSASGVKYSRSIPVTLTVGEDNINGEFDLDIQDAVYEGIYDIKSASPYAYDYKFANYETLAAEDDFGYIAQGFGYGEAANRPFKGWIVINKVDGSWKIISTPAANYTFVKHGVLNTIKKTIDYVKRGFLPPCDALQKEQSYGKDTGRTIIGKKCKYCPHWEKCHPTAVEEPCKVSRAKIKPMKRYVK